MRDAHFPEMSTTYAYISYYVLYFSIIIVNNKCYIFVDGNLVRNFGQLMTIIVEIFCYKLL